MGMYDTFEGGFQVKCFGIPVFYWSSGHQYSKTAGGSEKESGIKERFLGEMGGLLRYFRKGDPVPWKAWNYVLPDSFLIISSTENILGSRPFDPETGEFHAVEDGIYVGSWESIRQVPGKYLSLPKIGYYRERIKGVNSYEDFIDFNTKDHEISEERIRAARELRKYWKPFETALRDQTYPEDKKIEAYKKYNEESRMVFAKCQDMMDTFDGKYYDTLPVEEQFFQNFGGYLFCAYSLAALDESEEEKRTYADSRQELQKQEDLRSEFADYCRNCYPDSQIKELFDRYKDWNRPNPKEEMKMCKSFVWLVETGKHDAARQKASSPT